MPRLFRNISRKVGLPPGTPVHVGDEKTEAVKITVMEYDEETIHEREVGRVEEGLPSVETKGVTWINIDGVHRVENIEAVGEHLGVHPLLLEDIVHTGQRPKMEDSGDTLFLVFKMILPGEDGEENVETLRIEQVSLIVGPHFVVSFQEREGDVFDLIRERIRSGKGRIRKMGADYLAYALMDAVVDYYFVILERTGEQVEEIEDEVISDPTPETLDAIHRLKREMIFVRRSVWPLREVISGLEKSESPLIRKSTRIYIRDLYDHTIQVMDAVENFRDMAAGLLEIYLSSISNKMNTVMKMLTLIATIFIPLTFIAGVYGMNFEYMPELEWRWGYFVALAVMFVVGAGMGLFFRFRKWL